MASHPISVKYNENLKPLEKCLSGVDRAGDFFVSGKMEVPMPKIEIADTSVLSFPVPEAQIRQLVTKATLAPYGRGEETILDVSVRKVWQLPSEAVKISGKSWTKTFNTILEKTAAGLGCAGIEVGAELYKMLIYDTGGFFLAHRDTEKACGMFGTLVVVLPSIHHGGELLIRHAGREATVNMSSTEISELSFAAFYADCEHEVRPITEGNRVCLIYNLVSKSEAQKNPLQAPDYEKQTDTAARLLDEKMSTPDAPIKIAWLLDHHYSPNGLSFSSLKSTDAARVQVLTQAASRTGCAAHLGIVHIEEYGTAEPIYYDWHHHRGRRWDDDECDDDFEVVDVYDGSHYIAQWRNEHGEEPAFGKIPLAPDELLPTGALDNEMPDKQRLMEASGNEGASFERSYHRAALVLWRRDRYADVLLQAGIQAALPYLKEKIDSQASLPENRQEAIALALRMIAGWKPTAHSWEFHTESEIGDDIAFHDEILPVPDASAKRNEMVYLLIRLGEAHLMEEFVSRVVTRDYDGSENTALLDSSRLLGATQTGVLFAELIRRNMPRCFEACAELLHALTSTHEPQKHDEWKIAGQQIAGAAIDGLDKIGEKSFQAENTWSQIQTGTSKKTPAYTAFTVNLLDALAELDMPEGRATTVEKIAARPGIFDPAATLTPVLAQIRQRNDAASSALWKHCAEFLLLRNGQPPQAPADWCQDATLSCTCADCRELQKFARAPAEQTHRFRVRKDRRQHLHAQIEHQHLEMKHATERKGSPHTLVCTKDRRRYQHCCQQYRKDIAAMKDLSGLANEINAPAALLKSMETARVQAEAWTPA